jgi:hypothetical protein
MWNVYADDDPNHPAKPNENAMPGLAPTTAPGPDHVELVVDGEKFVLTRRTAPVLTTGPRTPRRTG